MEVYVLNIKDDDGVIYTSVYSTLEKAIDSVKEEYRLHDIEDLFDKHNVEDELKTEMYNTDGSNTYYIECCKVW